jgi:hypothetical protein
MGARVVSPVALVLLAALATGCAVARPRALVIGIEGVSAADLALAPTPALDALVSRGAAGSAAVEAYGGTEAWAVLLTGAGAEGEGATPDVSDDAWLRFVEGAGSLPEAAADGADDARPTDEGSPAAIPTIFGRLKAARGRAETGCFNAGSEIALGPGSLLGASRAGLDCFFSPLDRETSVAWRDRETADAGIEGLSGAGRFGGADLELAFVHLAPDAGAPPEQRAAAADRLVGELAAALAARPGRGEEQWLVVVALVPGGGAPPRLVTAADGILPHRIDLEGASLADVAPTVLAWLGIGGGNELAGRPLVPR